MIKYELEILFSERINRLLLLILILIAIVFSCFAIGSVTYVDQEGNTHNGLFSARKLAESKSKYEGKLTPDVLKNVIQKDRQITKEYGNEISDSVYSTGAQEYGDIKDFCVSTLCYDTDFDESVLNGLEINDAGRIYEIRDGNIAREIEEYGTTQAKAHFLQGQYSKISTPFDYAPAESWKTMGLYATTYAMILLIIISFLAAGIFSREFKQQADSIFFSTRLGRSKGTRAKIATGLIMATAIYWLAMFIMSIVSFGVMGLSGAKSPIQIEYSYCMYAYTFMQRYLVILLAGYIGSILAATVAMLVSAKTHSSLLAICFPFVLFIVSPFIGRVLPFNEFFNVTPDQLVNVYNCIRLPLLYQFGDVVIMQIPMIMALYTLVTIMIIPLIYMAFNRYCAL